MPEALTYLLPIIALLIGAAATYIFLKNSVISNLQRGSDEKSLRVNELESNLENMRNERDDSKGETIRLEEKLLAKEEDLASQKTELVEIQKQMNEKFKLIAAEILDNNSRKIQEQHETKLKALLDPLKERIKEFEKKVQDNNEKNIERTTALTTQIQRLKEMNESLGQEAKNLTAALKGDKKMQGDWGEKQLEMILQSAGLTKDIHYATQRNLKSEDGSNFRPDVVVNLPNDKHLIIDSKVSLVAFEAYYNSDDETEKGNHMATHLLNVKNHIKDLSKKDYPALYGINPPDYVLMYVPLDSALYAAMTEDTTLFDTALRSQIVLVSNTTLFATLKTISYIWQQENVTRNTQQIKEESVKLYDKFYGFVEDLTKVGRRLDSAKDEYESAMKKLSKGRGHLLGRVEKIKGLGLNTGKDLTDLDSQYLDMSDLREEDESDSEK